MKTLLTLTAALLIVGPSGATKSHRAPRPSPPSRNAARPKAAQPPHRQPREEAARLSRIVLQRARGEGHSLWFPPPEIWLASSRRR